MEILSYDGHKLLKRAQSVGLSVQDYFEEFVTGYLFHSSLI